ncbi:hypothetical protein KHA80_18530 [Anaerobacillus sp. HL2]|nr:hypothetical protein KHA80_18530 [Anaerobacillus sp. HL2]
MSETPAFGTDEIVYVNLAKQLGFTIKKLNSMKLILLFVTDLILRG